MLGMFLSAVLTSSGPLNWDFSEYYMGFSINNIPGKVYSYIANNPLFFKNRMMIPAHLKFNTIQSMVPLTFTTSLIMERKHRYTFLNSHFSFKFFL